MEVSNTEYKSVQIEQDIVRINSNPNFFKIIIDELKKISFKKINFEEFEKLEDWEKHVTYEQDIKTIGEYINFLSSENEQLKLALSSSNIQVAMLLQAQINDVNVEMANYMMEMATLISGLKGGEK